MIFEGNKKAATSEVDEKKTGTQKEKPAQEKPAKIEDILKSLSGAFSESGKKLDAILETLQVLQDVDERDPIEIAYPSDGTLKILPTGKSTFDFMEGNVVFADITTDDFEFSLKKTGRWMRSLTIEAQTLGVTLSFDGGKRATKLTAGRILRLANTKFRSMIVNTGGATGSIRFWASTSRFGGLVEVK